MTSFQVGDVVQLKSGGPLMTIHDIGDYSPGPNPGVRCVWFDGPKPLEEVFDVRVLEEYRTDPGAFD